MTLSRTFADFASGLTLERVPEQVRTRACHLMLDAVGTGYAALGEGWGEKAFVSACELAGGTSPVLGHGRQLTVRDAALVNGVLMHGLDFDDTHSRGVIHATVSSLPAAWALADRTQASGADLLLAYIIAMEVSIRVGMVAAGRFHDIGFHPTGLAGTFGATLAAARLLQLDAEQMVMAQGIALSMTGGSLEFLDDGAWTKRLHPGLAASAGITAATLARNGYVGPRAAYEGRFGLFSLYMRDRAPAALEGVAAGLSDTWELENVAVKPIPACHFTHAPADAAAALHAAHELTEEMIDRVTVLVPEGVVNVVCEPAAPKRVPATSYDAQFSIPYTVANGLLKGQFTLAELKPEALSDPAVLALAQRVEYQVDPASDFPVHYTGEVVVHTRDGRVLRHREAVNRGAADRPLTNAEIRAKFDGNIALSRGPGRSAAIADAVLSVADRPATLLGDLLAARS